MIAEGNVRLKQAELEQAQTELERVKNGLPSGDLAVLEAAVVGCAARVGALESWTRSGRDHRCPGAHRRGSGDLNLDNIEASFDGVLTGVYTKVGDVVDSGAQAFKLDDLSRLLVDTSVSEVDINKIQAGQPVRLSFDSVPGENTTARWWRCRSLAIQPRTLSPTKSWWR